MSEVPAIILAAGSSSRMGVPKQLLPIHKMTLLEHCLKNIKDSAVSTTICVLGANSAQILDEVKDKEVIFICNKDWKKGLSSSIQAGVRYLRDYSKSHQGILITLADQPEISSQYYNELLHHFSRYPDHIIASRYDTRCGVPAIFPEIHTQSLMDLEGDRGAGSFLNSIQENIISVNNNINLMDLDTPEQYKVYLQKINFSS